MSGRWRRSEHAGTAHGAGIAPFSFSGATMSIRVGSTLFLVMALLGCRDDDATIETTSGGETNMSASADSAVARGTAMLRFVNATEEMRFASLQLDGTMLFDSVKAASVTDYREVDKRIAQLTARAAGGRDTASLATDNKVLVDGNRYSAFLMSENMTTRRLHLVEDEVIPDSGKARLRVIHAASGAPAIDVRALNGTDNLFSNVSFAGNGGYRDIEPVSLSLQVREQGTSRVLLTIPAMSLKRGSATTVVITGSTKLSYFTFSDSMMPRQATP
jgi:hypothetical protein